MSYLIFALMAMRAEAQQFRIVAIENSPIVIAKANTEPDGVAIHLAKDLVKSTNLKVSNITITPSRIMELSKANDAIFPFVTRSPDRESHFQWIGKIATDKFCFLSLKKRVTYASIEDAKKSKGICVTQGGLPEKMLKEKGFTNIDSAIDGYGCTRKLFAEKIDSIFMSELVGRYAAIQANVPVESTVCSLDLGQREYWMATSVGFPKETFAKLKAGYEQLASQGKVQEYLDQYLKEGVKK